MNRLFILSGIILLAGSACEAKKQSLPHAPLAKPSGIYGRVLRIGFPPRNPEELEPGEPNAGDEIPCWGVTIVVRRLPDKKVVERAKSNREGNFNITLPPGEYEVEPLFPLPAPPVPEGFMPIDGSVNRVTVWQGFYTKVEAVFDGGW